MEIKKLIKKAALYTLPSIGAVLAAQFYLLHEIPQHLKTAEEYLESIGVDPEIASELSDKDIKVIERDLPGYAMMFLKFPYEAKEILDNMSNPNWAAADRRPAFHNECHVIIPSEDFNAKTVIAELSRIDQASISTALLSGLGL